MAIVAHARPFVIGVDTHARNHAISILACPTGEIVDEAQFPTTTLPLIWPLPPARVASGARMLPYRPTPFKVMLCAS